MLPQLPDKNSFHHHHHLSRSCHCWQMTSTTWLWGWTKKQLLKTVNCSQPWPCSGMFNHLPKLPKLSISNKRLRITGHTNPEILASKEQRSKYLSMFTMELLGDKTYPAKSVRNLGVIFDKNFISSYMYLQSVVHVFTTAGIYGVFTVILIWREQNCLWLLWCLAVLITVNQFCLGLRRLTSPSRNIFWTVWLVWYQRHLLAVFHCRAPFNGCQWNVESISRSAWWPLYGSSWETTCLPSLFDCHFSSIMLTEMKQRNHSVHP